MQLPSKQNLGLSLLASLLLLPASGLAANQLPTLVVSATGYQQEALRAPAAISSLTQEDILRTPNSDLAEILRDLPGVDVVDSGVPGMKRLSLRGESSRRVLIKINGQPLPDHSTYGSPLLIDVSLIDKLEVVRGAASVVHGSNALGGVINITTKAATQGLTQGYANAGYYSATHGYKLGAGILGAAAGFDWRLQVAQAEHKDLRVAAKVNNKPAAKGAEETYEKRLRNSGSEQKSVSAELGYRLDEEQRIAWQGDYFDQAAKAWVEPVHVNPPAMPIPLPKSIYTSLEFPKRESTRNALAYSFDQKESWLQKINLRAYYQKNKREMYNRIDQLTTQTPPMGQPVEAYNFGAATNTYDDLTTSGFQSDLQLNLFAENITLVGMEYQLDKLDTLKEKAGDLPTTQKAEQSFWSAFVQQQLHLTDALEANLGARYYSIDSKLKQSSERATASKSDDQLVGAASLVWQTSDISSLRMNLAQGYTYPSLTQQFSATAGNSAMNYGNPNLKAEKATTLEVGGRVEGKQLTLDATLYHSRAKDFIDKRVFAKGAAVNGFAACTTTHCFEWFNANKAATTGLELLAAYQLNSLRPYMNLAVQKRQLTFKHPKELKTWDSGLPIFKTRTGIEWQANEELTLDFYVRSYGKSEQEGFNSQGTAETQRTSSYAEFNLEVFYAVNQNLSLSAAALNLSNGDYQNPEELPSAGRAFNAEVNWRF